MVTPQTRETFLEICSYWAKIITTPGENGTHIWVPSESARHRFRDFVEDDEVQEQLFGDNKPLMFIVDAYEQEKIDYDEIKAQISESLGYTTEDKTTALKKWFEKYPNRKVVLFLMGFSNALRKNNTLTIQRLASIASRHNMHNVKVILFTDINIFQSECYDTLLRSTNILQNILVQPVFAPKDIMHFVNYYAEEWHMQIPDAFMSLFVHDIGGHFLLVKEAMRLLRDNPVITRDQLLSSPTLVRKGVAIFDRLSQPDKKSIQQLLQGNKQYPVSEYLLQTRLVDNGVVGLPYWQHIKVALFALISDIQSAPSVHSIDFYFTSTERDVFELLSQNKRIVSREEIAEQIWNKGWEDKYSDWAIDQLMHRIREKLKLTNSLYTVQTKKGQGFFIAEKNGQ